MSYFLGFHTVKAVTALIGADWGCQTCQQAQRKSFCWRARLAHVAIVALVQALCAFSARNGWRRAVAFVAINAATHFVIDGYRMNKVADQALHVGVAVVTAPLLRGEG